MKIKEKVLASIDKKLAARERAARAEARKATGQRIQRHSEFITHVRLLDGVHEAYRAGYTVRAKGHALCRKSDIATVHLVAPRS